MNFDGQRVAIAGMAKSGISVAKAVRSLGGTPTVFDQKPADSQALMNAIDELHAAEVTAAPGWHGRLDPADYDWLVVSPGFPIDHPAVKDMASRTVMGEVEFAYRISTDPIVAITGTNGKSTTTVLAWRLLEAAGKNALLCGNIAGSGYAERTLTDAALEGGDVLVAEVSSFQLETVDRFRPFVAAITTIVPDHLDRHSSFEEYRQCKLRMFRRMRGSDVIVVNTSDGTIDLEELPEEPRKIRFSASGEGTTNGSTARVLDTLFLSGHQLRSDKVPLVGEHNVANVLMAWEIACAIIGEPSQQQADSMLSALLTFKGLANRMEPIGERDGVLVVNNSMCTNPSAVVSSSRGLARPQRLLLGGNRKTLDFTEVGEYVSGTGHSVYLFGPDTEELNRQMGSDWPAYDSMQEAFAAACIDAKEPDVVVLMPGCASAHPFTDFKHRGDVFRELAKEWTTS